MTETKAEPEKLKVDLRNPIVAAILAWLVPGWGHFYQRRHGKGVLYMLCILSTWFFGLALGGGHTVYASSNGLGRKLQFACQLGVGLPAVPAIVQANVHSKRLLSGQPPLFFGMMAPPREPPEYPGFDDLSEWHHRYGAAFDMGVLYTMIAGLLNVLAVYDALGGPMPLLPAKPKQKPKADEKPEKPPSKAMLS